MSNADLPGSATNSRCPMSDFKDDLRRYIDGIEEPVSVQETMSRRQERRFRAPAAVLAGAAIVMIPALVLIGLRMLPANESDVADSTVPPTTVTTTTVVETTTTLAPQIPEPIGEVGIPNLDGLTELEASDLLEDLGLKLEITEMYPSRSGFGLITAQHPLSGEIAGAGTTVEVGIRVEAPCLSGAADPDVPAESMTVNVLFGCAGDGLYPDISGRVSRAVPSSPDKIEATLQALLVGLTEQERLMGYDSFFSTDSAGALNSVVLDRNRLVVDFNDNIIINNASTSTGGMYFLAELQANLFQFPEVDVIEFRLNGSCDDFWMWLQSSCSTLTRGGWEVALASWEVERERQPEPGHELDLDEIVGSTFTASPRDESNGIDRLLDGVRLNSGFDELGGWLLDTATAEMRNWAVHVSGLNTEMVWLVESQGQTDSGHMIYEARATLEIRWDEFELNGDPALMTGNDFCSRGNEDVPGLIVMNELADRTTGEMHELRAWLIDTAGARFVEIPTDGIACQMEVA
ncbi:MAG: PASTA domain-containing protein [bacterium]|nr:PASTA domain-containing protein [bacterium]